MLLRAGSKEGEMGMDPVDFFYSYAHENESLRNELAYSLLLIV